MCDARARALPRLRLVSFFFGGGFYSETRFLILESFFFRFLSLHACGQAARCAACGDTRADLVSRAGLPPR